MQRQRFRRATSTAGALTLALALGGSAFAQDSDADGTPDASDVFPCDAAAAAVAYSPAQDVHGLIIFEDEWPNTTDFDANDVVVAYNYALSTNTAGQATSLRITLSPLALGGLYDNGLKLQLPIPASQVTAATIRVGTGQATNLTASGADTNFTVTLSANLRALFGGQADQINSLTSIGRLTGETVQVDLTFGGGVGLAISEAPYDLFIFRANDPGLEIHQPRYTGSSAMRSSLFGTGLDNSGNGRNFVFTSGVPAVMLLPETAEYPSEGVAINNLYPDIIGFADSGGTSNQDFYVSTVVSSAAYKDNAGLGAPAPTFLTNPAIDSSCVGANIGRTIPGFSGQVGPDFSGQGYSQCVGYLDRAGGDDIPNNGWATPCASNTYDRVRIACGANASSVRYIDVSRNVFQTGLNSYPETGLIVNSNFSLPNNQIYSSGNQPNSNTSWWVTGNGCSETTASLTINNSCSWEASNCFGQGLTGQRYLYVYVGTNHCADGVQNVDETGVDCGGSTCSACPTCSDGIMNQGETAVDCGGPCAPCSTGIVPGFTGVTGPSYNGWTQCVGYLDRAGGDDIPNSGWADACRGHGFTNLRVACGPSTSSARYIDVSRNIFETGLNSYPENNLITSSNFSLPSNQIYASGNQPNTGTSWWVTGNGCSETTASLTINNSCSWEASNCFGQNINGQRYLFVYGK